MRGAVALTIVLGALALLVLFGSSDTVAGLRPEQLASAASLLAIGVFVFGWVISHYRGQWSRALEALAFWIAMLVGLVALYSYRFDLASFANRILGEIAPGYTVSAVGGEVSVARRAGGSFVLNGAANGQSMRFIFDTGASVVVLTAEAAARAGYRVDTLDFSHPVTTANGRTMAAAVTLDSLTIGSITERRVPALIAKPGALFENLLGMTFLERLASYSVQDDRLVLRGRSL